MNPYSPPFISPYNILSKIPRSHLDPLLVFLQCGKHSKLGTIYSISIPELSIDFTNSCSMVPNYLNNNFTNLGGKDLVSRVITEDAISGFSQYNFDMGKLTVYSKYVTLPKN